MKELMNPQLLLPIGIFLFQVLMILFACIVILRKVKIIKSPISGMEYSQAIYAGSILFAAFYITTASVQPLFQSFKTYQNLDTGLFRPLLSKSGQILLVVIFFEVVLALLLLLLIRLLFRSTKPILEIESGNIPFALFIGVIVIVLSISCQIMAAELMDYITPHYISIR